MLFAIPETTDDDFVNSGKLLSTAALAAGSASNTPMVVQALV